MQQYPAQNDRQTGAAGYPPQPQRYYAGAGQPETRNGTTRRPRTFVQRRKRKRPFLKILLVLLVLGLAAGGGYYYSQYSRVKPYELVFMPNISIDGIDLSAKTVEQAKTAVFESVDQRQNSWSLSITYQGHTFSTLNYELMGIQTDEAQVYALLNQAYAYGHSGGTFDRIRDLEYLEENPLALYTTQSAMTDTNVETILSKIALYLEKEPTDAYLAGFSPDADDPFTIVAETEGQTLDIAPYKQEILERAARGESGTLELETTPVLPSVTTADIRKTVTLLSTGTTAISSASTEGRTSNIKIAFGKINGMVLEDGKTFSFNDTVGKRTAKNGFAEAIEYAYGEQVMGIGGGVCQASTTVYLAAVTSNLEIVKRTKHSLPVNYTELGQDATVSDRGIDFKFKNTSGGTIYITAHVENVKGSKKKLQCVVKIYGPSLGDDVYYKLRSVKTQELEPGETEIRKDKKAQYVTYEDQTYTYRKSSKGSVVETYLQRWENGKMTEEHLITTDTYEARNEIVYVGVTSR